MVNNEVNERIARGFFDRILTRTTSTVLSWLEAGVPQEDVEHEAMRLVDGTLSTPAGQQIDITWAHQEAARRIDEVIADFKARHLTSA